MSSRMLPASPVKGFWELLKGFRGGLLWALLTMACAISLEIASNFLLRDIVDTIVKKEEGTPVFLFAMSFIVIAVAKGIFLFFSGKAVARASEGSIEGLRNRLFDHMQKLSYQYHDKMKTGELIQRSTSDVDSIRRFFQEMIPGIARISMLYLFNLCGIIILSWKLALISSLITPVIAVTSAFFFRRIHTSFESYQEQDGTVSATLQENLSGMRIVRAFARQEFENSKFETDNSEQFRRGIKFLLTHSVYWPVSHILCAAQMVIGFTYAGFMAISGTISLGSVFAYIGMVLTLIWPLQQLGRMIANLSTSFVSYNRVKVILDAEKEDLDSGTSTGLISGNITVKNLEFSYEENIPVLKDISFSVKKGEKIALLGEAGSGKTTFVNLLPRFYDFYKGDLLLDGKPLQSYSRQFLRKNIGIVEQEPFLFSTSLRENICLGVDREVTQKEIENAAKAASIHKSILGFQDGYNTLVGEKGVTLSGGQKQRIAIARTILKDPRILILDDSTSAVDAETEDNIRECLSTLMAGRTSFIIAHRIQSLMDADRILVFKDGKIVQDGSHDELVKESGFYRKVFDLQTRIEEELDKEINYA